jgi:predicted transcriptional regulator
MAMTLRLSDKQTAALKKVAEHEGVSMQEAALTAVDEYLSKRQVRLTEIINRISTDDKELLDRLAK